MFSLTMFPPPHSIRKGDKGIMDISHSLRLRQQQRLVMTPQLQQVIRLLQVNTTELEEIVRKELETNPTLEEADEDEPLPQDLLEGPREAEEKEISEKGMDDWLAMAAEEGPREHRDRDREQAFERMQENQAETSETLGDHLLAQVHLSQAPENIAGLAEAIIGNLDGNGYLPVPLTGLAQAKGIPVGRMEEALRLVQSLDPVGVGARDLKECLLLQLDEQDEKNSLARRLVVEHLDHLDHNRPNLVAELAGLTGESAVDVEKALKLIRFCDPKPGSRFVLPAQRIFPDGRIEKEGNKYIVQLNDDGVPPLRLSRQYREMLAKRDTLGAEEKKFLQEGFRNALMLLRGIAQRRSTMTRLLEHLVKVQGEFLEKGRAGLRPLTMREVADAIGVHEATVSRVVANKYVETPRGIYAFRDFFSTSLASEGEGTVSGAAVRERIRDLVEKEDTAEPLSDDKLAEMLNTSGVKIARRTVAKYREALKIPKAFERKGRAKQ